MGQKGRFSPSVFGFDAGLTGPLWYSLCDLKNEACRELLPVFGGTSRVRFRWPLQQEGIPHSSCRYAGGKFFYASLQHRDVHSLRKGPVLHGPQSLKSPRMQSLGGADAAENPIYLRNYLKSFALFFSESVNAKMYIERESFRYA